ncbi:MAG: hypothetical protein IJT91_05205, partial [Clostridia bacterium]|nr:hypothetical protein [Clostridia bacterium]
MKKIISLALVLCMIVPFCIFDMGVTGSAAHQEIDDASTTKWYTWGQHYYNANNTPYEPDYSYSGDLTHSVDTTSDYYKVSPNPVTWKISNGGIVAQNKTFKPAHVSSSVAKIKPGGFNITFTRESGDYITTNHRGVMSIGFIFDDDLPFKSFPVNYDNMSVWGVLGRSNTYNDSKSLTVNFYNTTDNSAALGIQYNYFRVFYNTSKLTNEFTNLPVTEGTLSKPFIFGTTYTGKLYLTRTGTNTFTLYYQRGTNAAQALATGLSIDENADIKYVAAVTGGYAGNESDATGSDTLTIKTVGKCGSASNAPNGFTGGGHAFETTVAATCLTAGTETCSCGVTRTVAAYGHDFGSWQDASGYQYRECSRCGICEKKVTVTYYDHTGANPTTQTGTVEVASSSGLGAANVSITTKAANTFTLTDDANTYGEAAGYEFNGWASSALTPGNEASSVKSASTAYNFTSNTSLYANWKAKTFSLTLDPNGGSLASGVTSPVSIKYKQVYSTVFSSYPTATRNGYVFNNWDYNGWEFNSTKMSETYSAAGNATLTAKWTPKTSALTFNMNGGSGTAPTGLVATYGQAMPTYGQSAPTNGVMVFEGFYDDPSGGTKYYNSNLSSARSWDKDITVGTTLYAHWGTSYGYENGDAVTNKQMTNSADSTWKSKWNVFHNGSERIKLKTNETNDARKGYLQFEGQNVTGFSSGVTSGTQTKLFGSSVSFSIDSNWTSNDIISLAFSNAHMNVQPSNAGQVPTGIYANVSSAYNEDFAPAYGNDIENITENSVHKPGVSISIRTLTPEENATEVIVNDVWVKMYDPNNLNNCQTYHYKYNWYDTSSGDVTYMKTLYGNDGVNPPLMRCTLPGVVRLDAAGRIVTNGSEKVFDPLTLKLGPDAENTISFDDDGDLFINDVKITPYQDRKLN